MDKLIAAKGDVPVRTFLNGCGLVAERVNRSSGQLPGREGRAIYCTEFL